MTSLNSLFSIARDGLQAQSAGVSVTGQNITNVNTPGYVRRGVLMQPRQYGGVNVTGVSRSFQRTSHSRLVEEHGRHGAAQLRASALSTVESIVAPGVPTIGDRINSFFQSLDTLSGAPTDRTARLDVLQRTTALAQQVSGTAADLSLQRSDLFTQATGITAEVNDRLTRIASLNLAIAQATGEGDAATDLRDTRDQLVLEVGDRLGARAVEDARGQVTLFAAGTALVEGGHASTLSVSLDPANNLLFQVQQTGGAATNVTSFVTQGSLGGLREVRDTDIVQVQTNLDQFAFDLATAVNGVHSAGFGLDGVTGRPLFTTSATAVGAARALTVNAAVAGQPDRLAAATLASDLPGGNGTARLLANLASRPLGAAGVPPTERYGALSGDVGTRMAVAESDLQLREDTVLQAANLHESSSGVSLDEEMINLSKFQRAFEASTRVLRVADELLDNLIKSF
jgi:flagellar hook-associated protein 1 FlgK